MKLRDDRTLKAAPEADGSCEMMVMHRFDKNLDNSASKENVLCGADTSADDLGGANGDLDDRLYGLSVGVVCEGCKTVAFPFAESLIRDLETGGRVDEAEENSRLVDTFLRETGSRPFGPGGPARWSMYAGFHAFYPDGRR